HRHEQSCRNALSADITDHDGDSIRIDHEEIIEIASDIARRAHVSVNVEVLPAVLQNLIRRQHCLLYCTRICHFLALRLTQHDLLGEMTKRLREIGELGQWMPQIVEQLELELAALQSAERVRIEPDRSIECLETTPELRQHGGQEAGILLADA